MTRWAHKAIDFPEAGRKISKSSTKNIVDKE